MLKKAVGTVHFGTSGTSRRNAALRLRTQARYHQLQPPPQTPITQIHPFGFLQNPWGHPNYIFYRCLKAHP